MIRRATVKNLTHQWPGSQITELVITQAPSGSQSFLPGTHINALSYTGHVGLLKINDQVQVDTSALAKTLGTGGLGIILANETTLPPDDLPEVGHLVKARYTPTQTLVMGIDEQDSPHHEKLCKADSITPMVGIIADLHSALPAVLVGLRSVDPKLTVAYIYPDGGALPATFSQQIARLRELEWIDSVITCGQAYGGDMEAVNVHSALLAAHIVVKAKIAIVIQGPGNLGTDTRWGFSGLSCGEHLNAVQVLGGTAVGILRMSQSDTRQRHRGISHHSMTAYRRIAKPGVHLPIPNCKDSGLPYSWTKSLGEKIEKQQTQLKEAGHHLHQYDPAPLYKALEQAPINLSTMGRNLQADPLSFIAAATGGKLAAELAKHIKTPTARKR